MLPLKCLDPSFKSLDGIYHGMDHFCQPLLIFLLLSLDGLPFHRPFLPEFEIVKGNALLS